VSGIASPRNLDGRFHCLGRKHELVPKFSEVKRTFSIPTTAHSVRSNGTRFICSHKIRYLKIRTNWFLEIVDSLCLEPEAASSNQNVSSLCHTMSKQNNLITIFYMS
jgi:hypothetical protein